MMKEIGVHEGYKHWNLVRRRKINGKNNITSIWNFERKRDPDRSLIKHKYHLWAHGSMNRWRVKYWDNYYLVVNLMSFRAMITLIILRESHTKSVFIFAYT